MIDKIMSLLGIHRTGMVIGVGSNIIKAFEQEFAKDQDAKKAAIDTLVSILLSYKESTNVAPPASPAIPPTA